MVESGRAGRARRGSPPSAGVHPSPALAYGVAVLSVAVVTLIRVLLYSVLGAHARFLSYPKFRNSAICSAVSSLQPLQVV